MALFCSYVLWFYDDMNPQAQEIGCEIGPISLPFEVKQDTIFGFIYFTKHKDCFLYVGQLLQAS